MGRQIPTPSRGADLRATPLPAQEPELRRHGSSPGVGLVFGRRGSLDTGMPRTLTPTRLSLANLTSLADEVGQRLDWSSSYVGLVTVSVRAVFDATGVDQLSGRIAVDGGSVEKQVQVLCDELRRSGRSEQTLRTYVSTWKRLARIAHEWTAARSGNKLDLFWARIGQFANNRGRPRTRTALSPTSPSVATNSSLQPPQATAPGDPPATSESTGRPLPLTVRSQVDRISLTLPNRLSPEDALALIRAILLRSR